jgi:hypothetical protein
MAMPTPTSDAISPLAVKLSRSRMARQISAHTENAQKIKNSVVFMVKER